MVALALAVVTSFPYDNYSASVAAAFFVYLFYFFTLITFLNVNFRNYTVLALIRLRVAMASISTANYCVTGAGQVYSGRSSYVEYSSIQQAIYGQAVKPAGRFNDRT
jgi:hypothetical protein